MNNLDQILSWGKDVLEAEAKSLLEAKETLSEDFSKAADLFLSCEGKVIVSGMGKSGHVGKKIAATFASTGTSAFFLHPSEALHGDLGMVTENDVLLLIAYSGETQEVIEVAKYARRQNIKLVSITGNKNSTLAELSNFTLNGKVNGEADSLGLAPTSSSTVALALGDALAVSLMRAKGFSEKDFAMFHPGGKLGKRLSHVSDYMRKLDKIEFLSTSSTLHEALEAVTKQNFGIAPVVNDRDELIGAVTDGDIRRVLLKSQADALKLSAETFMSTNPKTTSGSILAIDAVDLMNNASITSLFVVDDRKVPVGVLRMHDLLAAKVI